MHGIEMITADRDIGHAYARIQSLDLQSRGTEAGH